VAITYTWAVTSLKTKNVSDDKQNAVVQTYWKKIGTDSSNLDNEGNPVKGEFSGATPFTVDPTDDSGPFIAFEELTEEDVLDWIKTIVVGQYEVHVNEQIKQQMDQKINPVKEAAMPWAPETPPVTPPPV
jgi:hypothetical protein